VARGAIVFQGLRKMVVRKNLFCNLSRRVGMKVARRPDELFDYTALTKPTSWFTIPCMKVTRTQEKILHAAKTLMLSKGYPATTVDEICENAKVSKGSFYHAFSSKEELGLSLLEWYHQGGAEKIFGGSFNSCGSIVKGTLAQRLSFRKSWDGVGRNQSQNSN
jgi:hypothetical protein